MEILLLNRCNGAKIVSVKNNKMLVDKVLSKKAEEFH
jgi:hypothetical protein